MASDAVFVWELAEAAVETIRVHREPRTEVFTPLRVPGAPHAAQLIPVRLTRGEFLDTGEKFQIADWLDEARRRRSQGEKRWDHDILEEVD